MLSPENLPNMGAYRWWLNVANQQPGHGMLLTRQIETVVIKAAIGCSVRADGLLSECNLRSSH